MRSNRIAVVVAATAVLLAGGIDGVRAASAAPTAADHCGGYWDTSWPPPEIVQGDVDTTSPSAVMLGQCYLNLSMSGDNLTVDGRFGPNTRLATVRFQQCAGIDDDGAIGPVTWPLLRSWANSSGYVCDLDLP
ncbi:peptidoglycan-binding domain-containing protein [Streptomyces sp. 11x1]|uniref:peptidoglycan-binding domain-containing protein n=1 Tax=Streptomyces sp. 11x1 TaxID=3038642 RepID=UPI002930F24D|nr:peptidoglycan-binding domain-containing protein [Streptomyces sp. 11x1]WNZ07230.1 peptidoglycan-binding domain-containing protein [Streptomyces sp. 11x1]